MLRGIYVPVVLPCYFLTVRIEELVVMLLIHRAARHEGMGVTIGAAVKDTGPIPGSKRCLCSSQPALVEDARGEMEGG